jgi:hypothetical protein
MVIINAIEFIVHTSPSAGCVMSRICLFSGKYHSFDPEMVAKDCFDYKGEDKPVDTMSDPLSLNMGQATVYRLRIACRCRSVGTGERCSTILPFDQQSWPGFMGHNGNGHFRPRHS